MRSPWFKFHRWIPIATLLVVLLVPSCTKAPMPKPYGYYRLSFPPHEYTTVSPTNRRIQRTSFLMNNAAQLLTIDSASHVFFDIDYPTLNATIHYTYLPIHSNLPALLSDAQEMVYSHSIKASAIPEQEYMHPEHKVYGMLYELQGNTATPAQFYLTDSVHHFLRAAVYINTVPNQDSLAPVIDYLISDVRIFMESFRWN